MLQVPKSPGFAELLSGQCCFKDALRVGWLKNIDVLPAGRYPERMHALIADDRLDELLEYARQKYRYVVLDTPPLLAASEALVFAKKADASLLVTMRDVSTTARVRLAYERLVASGVNTVGAVLNGVPTYSYTYRYGQYQHSEMSGEDA